MAGTFQFAGATHAPANFLREIAKNVTSNDIGLLRSEVVFEYPHVTAADKLVRPLEALQFPTTDLAAYKNAISELVYFRSQAGYSSWMKLYFATLYIYCESVEPTIADESDYYLVVVEFVLLDGLETHGRLFLGFVEWLFDLVAWQFRDQDYWLLLSWLLVRGRLGGVSEDVYARVFNMLKERKYGRDEIARLTVCRHDATAWLELQKKTQLPFGYSQRDFDEIILGRDQ